MNKLQCPCGAYVWIIDDKTVTCGDKRCELKFSHELFGEMLLQGKMEALSAVLKMGIVQKEVTCGQ